MIGPLTVAPGGFNHVLVVVDKFTKRIEYKPIVKISSDRVVDFISDIMHQFGFPHTIITDLGSNFTSQSFWDFSDNSCIDVKYASVVHPRANGQLECINGLVLNGLRTQPSKATGQSPFFLTYGLEAILLADIMWKSPRRRSR